MDKSTVDAIRRLREENRALREEMAGLSRLVQLLARLAGGNADAWTRPALAEAAAIHFAAFDEDGIRLNFSGPDTGNAGWAQYIADYRD